VTAAPGTAAPEQDADEVCYAVSEGVATITLNRPRRKNAFTLPMVNRWADLLTQAERDPCVGAIVVTGAGDSFSSGIDLDALEAIEHSALGRRRMLTENIHRVALTLDRLDKPVIAAVAGAAVGAGMDMALMCDMRIAGESAYFSEAYVRIGVVPGDGGCYYLPRLVGTAKAMELLLTGDRVDATEALRIGLVNRVVPDNELASYVQGFARRLAAGPPVATRLIKRTVYQSASIDLATALSLVASHMGVVMTTDDHVEALAAAKEQRDGNYTGR
jgi:enoyl-CoA hydratase/carnithine racemase